MRTLISTSLMFAAACAADSSDMPGETVSPTPVLSLEAPQSARVIRSNAVDVAIEVVRDDAATDDVVVTVEGLPAGVTAQPLTIPAGTKVGMLVLDASDDIALGTSGAVTVHATAGTLTTSAKLMLRLTDRPGALDSTFSGDGKLATWYTPGYAEMVTGTAITPDGKILTASREGNLAAAVITRINADGTGDTTFADSGVLPVVLATDSNVIGLAVRPDGVILLASSVSGTTTIMAFTADGAPYTEYGTNGKLVLSSANTGTDFDGTTVRALADGTLVIAARTVGGIGVARVTPGGALDSTFSADGVVTLDLSGFPFIHRIAVRADGAVVLAGDVSSIKTSRLLARLTPDGEPDSSFASTGTLVLDSISDGELHAVATYDDGRIVAFGARNDGKFSMLAFEASGSLGSMLETVVPFNALDALNVDDTIIAAGMGNDFNQSVFAKLDHSGALEPWFGTDGLAIDTGAFGTGHFITTLAVDGEGRVVGGGKTVDNGTTVQSVMRVWL
jgi:uncharacterized delta-60 repeat protein